MSSEFQNQLAASQASEWLPLTSADWRYEVKLVCPLIKLPAARSWIRQHPEGFSVAYPPRTVNSLYLDSASLDGLSANVMGISQRQKVRLRWYGGLDGRVDSPVLELKFKENMVGGKRQKRLDWSLDWQKPYPALLAELRRVAGDQWRQWLLWTTEAVLLNQYRREYYVTPDKKLRITLDFAQQAYDQRLSLRPNRDRPLPLPETAVIEIKAPVSEAKRLEQAVAYFPLSRIRNSKYANGVLAAL